MDKDGRVMGIVSMVGDGVDCKRKNMFFLNLF